jgi:mannose/fructose/N-acetylgalactosamine-specific phosphotransferase system component IID
MAGPLAAIGDSFFYGELRPALSLLSIFIMILFANKRGKYILLAPVVFIILYNCVHLFTRVWFIYEGFKYADKRIKTLIYFKSASKLVRFSMFVMALAALFLWLVGFGFSSEEGLLNQGLLNQRLLNLGYIDFFMCLIVLIFSFFAASKFGTLFSLFGIVTISVTTSILRI